MVDIYNPVLINPYFTGYPHPHYTRVPFPVYAYGRQPACNGAWPHPLPHAPQPARGRGPELKDYGPAPFAVDISEAAERNNTYRTALWTGNHLQVTLMSLHAGEDIGLEMHPDVDQFLRIEEGRGIVRMGKSRDRLDYERLVSDDDAIMVPAGTWHNVVNTGRTPLKLYSIYAPPHHPHGTVHATKADAMAAE